jgi:phosphomannomutase
MLTPSIFKTYDIRAHYPDQLDEDGAYQVGRAYAQLLQSENPGQKLIIGVSRDMRLSSESLKNKLIEGLIDQGMDVVDFGLCSTPTFYFGVAYFKYQGGIQVSASHNPKDDNGFKMVRARAVPISGESGINTIRDVALSNQFITPEFSKGQVTSRNDVLDTLVKVLPQEWPVDFSIIKPFKIVVDAANSMGIIDITKMFEKLPCEIIKINFELDGSFPSHQADPLNPENLVLAKQKIIETGADMAIVPDGDADRYFFIDEKGEEILQPIIRGIMAQLALKDHPGAAICYDIRPGRITRDMIESVGGKASVTRVGHSLIKEQMLKENAIFGGESSGHYFYKLSCGTFETPFILVWKFLEFVSQQNKVLSEIVAPYRIYFHSGEINSTVADPKAKLEEIKQKYSDGQLNELDGVSIEYPDFWFNVRPSNTEPLLRLALEAKTKEIMEQKRDELVALIRS